MNTKELTRGAMMCAIYGALLFINQQTALSIETIVPWIFVFPILIYTVNSNIKMSALVAIAMGLLTVFLGGFTTWFYSWTSIFMGWIYGIGVSKKWSNVLNLAIAMIINIISMALIVLVWTQLFGMDLSEDFALLHKFVPSIDFRVFACLFIVLMGGLQALCIHTIALLIFIKMHIETRPMKPIYKVSSPHWVAYVSMFIWYIYFFGQHMVELNQMMIDIIQLAWFADYALLVYFGIVYLLDACVRNHKQKLSFFVILLGFFPPINIIWVILGELDCLLQLRETKSEVKNEEI